MEPFGQILPLLCGELADELKNGETRFASELRLTANRPAALIGKSGTTILKTFITPHLLSQIAQRVCKGSLYSAQDRIKEGFLTVEGGHRVGFCGTVILREDKISHISPITSLCFRIAREVKGAADAVIPFIMRNGRVFNTLIISPPACGKTTLLRDIARQIGNELRVGIVDERSEIASTFGGAAQNDVGLLSAVLDGCPKAEGIMLLLRAMSPEVIITDEIGKEEDERAVSSLINAGAKLICTAHGYDLDDIRRRPPLGRMFASGAIEIVIVLSARKGVGTVEAIVKNY